VFGVSFPWIVGWLVLAAAIFTVYFRFVQFRRLRLAIKIARGRYTHHDEPGEIPHFQALSSAVSGTVGLGNIAGVGVAVTIGGSGATVWMIVAGLLGMCTKFVECTLGVRHREHHPDGTVSGGPMHYLRKGVAERLPGAAGRVMGHVLAAGAAVMILFFGLAGGNMFQANQTFAQLHSGAGRRRDPVRPAGAHPGRGGAAGPGRPATGNDRPRGGPGRRRQPGRAYWRPPGRTGPAGRVPVAQHPASGAERG
jgi:AGCS family alanine or glycine:cation symporter